MGRIRSDPPHRRSHVRTEGLTLLFLFQGTLPPPYSSAVSAAANGSLSSPVSTMTSHSSSSSLAKQRQSWLDLVAQASPVAAETAVVCSAQVHSEADGEVPEGSSQADTPDTGSNVEEEEEAQTAAAEPPEGQAPARLHAPAGFRLDFIDVFKAGRSPSVVRGSYFLW